MTRNSIGLIGCCLLVAAAAQSVCAQGSLANEEARRRLRHERLAREQAAAGFLELPEAPRQRFVFDYGGFVDFNYTNFRALRRRREVGYQDLRFWMSAELDNVQSVYARLRTMNVNWGSGDSFDGNDDDFVEPEVDILFYNLDVTGALRTYYGVDLPMDLTMRAGRQFITLGRGWLYFQRNDAILLDGRLGEFEVEAFAAKSLLHDDNFDVTAPRFDDSERYFYGGQIAYNGLRNLRPYGMWLFQRDQSGSLFADPVFKFDYDSNYLGAGVEGAFTPQWTWYAEGVRQWGESTSADLIRGLSKKDDIDAWAFDLGTEYYFDHPATPRVGLEYALATGDPDRGSITNTLGGNRLGTDDESFLAFGFMETGYSFAPRFSNLQFLKADGSIRPWGGHEDRIWRELTVGAAFYQYWKDRSQGVVSDVRVDRSSSELGQELDFYIDWQVQSDLRLTVQYGIFFPGQSLTQMRDTDYLSVGVLFNF